MTGPSTIASFGSNISFGKLNIHSGKKESRMNNNYEINNYDINNELEYIENDEDGIDESADQDMLDAINSLSPNKPKQITR